MHLIYEVYHKRFQFVNVMIYSLGYLLAPSLETRPDIFQVSFLAFKLAGKKNPVQNLNVSKISTDHVFLSDVIEFKSVFATYVCKIVNHFYFTESLRTQF